MDYIGTRAIALLGDICARVPIVNIVSTPATIVLLFIASAETGVNIFSSKNLHKSLPAMVNFVPFVSSVSFLIPQTTWTWRVHEAIKEKKEEEAARKKSVIKRTARTPAFRL